MADIAGMLDDLQYKTAHIRNGRQNFLRPERKQIRFPHFAGFAENLDMRSMRWI